MRIALISDIHGNAVALETALDDIADQHIDQIICLGDVAMLGPQPKLCIEQIAALNCPVVMGNTDEWLSGDRYSAGPPPDEDLPPDGEIVFWNYAQLTDADRAILAVYQPTVDFALDDSQSLLCFHGSPASNMDRLLDTTPADEFAQYFAGYENKLFAGGHMHIQIVRHLADATFLNPGSIGMPLISPPGVAPRRYAAHADYLIINWHRGTADLTFRRVPYALDDLRATVVDSAMPQADWLLAHWDEPPAE